MQLNELHFKSSKMIRSFGLDALYSGLFFNQRQNFTGQTGWLTQSKLYLLPNVSFKNSNSYRPFHIFVCLFEHVSRSKVHKLIGFFFCVNFFRSTNICWHFFSMKHAFTHWSKFKPHICILNASNEREKKYDVCVSPSTHRTRSVCLWLLLRNSSSGGKKTHFENKQNYKYPSCLTG